MLRSLFDDVFFFVNDHGTRTRDDGCDFSSDCDDVTIVSEDRGERRGILTDTLSVREDQGEIYFNDGDEAMLLSVAKQLGLR